MSRPLLSCRALGALAVSALAGALPACVPGYDACFVPSSIVSDVRVLAVRADPPEALYDLARDQVEPVLVRALLAGQLPGTRLRLRARLCVPGKVAGCPDSAPLLEGLPTQPDANDAALEVKAPAAMIAQARDQDPLKGYGGVRLRLELDATAGTDHALATKTLLFSPRATTPAPNRAIELDSVELLRNGALDQRLAQGGSAALFVPLTYGVRPRLAPLPGGGPALEEYDTIDLQGRAVHLKEQATWSFYTDQHLIFGDLRVIAGNPVGAYSVGSDEASEPTAGVAEPANGLVRVTPLEGADSHLWIVVRDSRGAVAWAALHARSIDDRLCDRGEGVPCAAGKSCCPTLFFGCN